MFQPSSSDGTRDGWGIPRLATSRFRSTGSRWRRRGTIQPCVRLPMDARLVLAGDAARPRNTSLYDTAPPRRPVSIEPPPHRWWPIEPACRGDVRAVQYTTSVRLSMDTQLSDIFGNTDPGSQVQNEITQEVIPVFEHLTVGDVDTFALQNILFYNHSLNLPNGSVPGRPCSDRLGCPTAPCSHRHRSGSPVTRPGAVHGIPPWADRRAVCCGA